MEKEILWAKKLEEILCDFSYEQLDDFLSAIDYSLEYGASMYISDEEYDSANLWAWLYSHDNDELNDIKRELQKYIGKSTNVLKSHFEDKMKEIGKNSRIKTLIAGNRISDFGFCSLNTYLHILRIYLGMEKKDEFSKDLDECFPNLYFVSDIDSTINTLNRNFNEIRGEIIGHLSALDLYKNNFSALVNEGKSNIEISKMFMSDMNIECSPQGDRRGIESLKLTLYNKLTKCDEIIVCELHTKFKKYNIDKTKQDRIYFFPGKAGIENGRVIIKHIGTHL